MVAVRYWMALLFVAFGPAAVLYWYSIHPLIRIWRRVGPRRTLLLHYFLVLLLAAAIIAARKPILSVEFGTNRVLMLCAVPLFIASIALRVYIAKELKKRILVGIPELDPASHGVRLLTQGVYSRVRHPRYAQVMVAAIAWAMFTNYLAAYIAALVMVVGIFGLVPLEERELRERFGAEYEEYSARVPRFIPHLWHSRSEKAATRVRS